MTVRDMCVVVMCGTSFDVKSVSALSLKNAYLSVELFTLSDARTPLPTVSDPGTIQ